MTDYFIALYSIARYIITLNAIALSVIRGLEQSYKFRNNFLSSANAE